SLLIHSARDPRALHSFPTRRSSDLDHKDGTPLGGDRNGRGQGRADPADAALEISRTDVTPPLPYARTAGRAHLSCAADDHLGAQDRKSTRLHSSHVKISYAVFCLTK